MEKVLRKEALRGPLRAARRARSDRERTELARGIAAVAREVAVLREARVVSAYASLPDEPGTGPLRDRLRRSGVRVLLPVVGEDRTLDWAVDTGDDGVETRGGLRLPEPRGIRLGPAALGEADVVVVPALAVDTSGTRLGKGRGYYDTALAHRRAGVPVIAVVHDDELLDAGEHPIPREAHDVPVDGVITPTRWVALTPHRG